MFNQFGEINFKLGRWVRNVLPLPTLSEDH